MNYTDSYHEIHLYLDALWRRRRVFLLVVLIMPILAMLSTLLLPQKYMASTSIAIDISELPAMKDIDAPTDIAEQFQMLKAYVTSPESLQKIAVETGMVSKKAEAEAIQGVAAQIRKGLTISLLDRNVIEIVLVQDTFRSLVGILNAISHSMIIQLSSQESSSAEAAQTVLTDSMRIRKQQLEASVQALSQYENQHPDILPEYADVYQNQLRQINTNISEQQADYSEIKAEKEELEKSLVKINPVITEIDGEILSNDIKISKLRLVYTDKFSGIKSLLQRNQSLRAERDKRQKDFQSLDENKIQQLWNLTLSKASNVKDDGNYQLLGSQLEKLLNMQLKLKGITQEIASLNAQYSTVNKKLRMLTDNKQVFLQLKQAVKDNQTAYEALLNRSDLANLSVGMSKNAQSIPARVVSYPETPTHSLSRPFSFFLVLGLASGISFGFVLTSILELIDNKARIKRSLEAATGFEVLCRVERLMTS